jgi:hypothetical protein
VSFGLLPEYHTAATHVLGEERNLCVAAHGEFGSSVVAFWLVAHLVADAERRDYLRLAESDVWQAVTDAMEAARLRSMKPESMPCRSFYGRQAAVSVAVERTAGGARSAVMAK